MEQQTLLERLALKKVEATKLQTNLDKVAPTKDNPATGPEFWTRLRYGAMFEAYKKVAIMLAEVFPFLDANFRAIQHAETRINRIYDRIDRMEQLLMGMGVSETALDGEVFDGDIPEDEELARSTNPDSPLNGVTVGAAKAPEEVQPLDLLS